MGGREGGGDPSGLRSVMGTLPTIYQLSSCDSHRDNIQKMRNTIFILTYTCRNILKYLKMSTD